MTRLGFISITAILILFFAVLQAHGTSGDQATSIADTPGDYGDSASCPPPKVLGYDSTIYLCLIEDICFDVFAINSGGDSLVITQVEGPGQFEMLTDTSGQTCFMPDEMDSATYLFAYTVDKACDTLGGGEPPLCPRDTIRITVVLNQAPYVNMADDFSVSLCQAESLCFPATADDPDFDIADVWVNFGNYDDVNDKVCFYADTAGVYTLILTAVDTCGAIDSDTTIVTVAMNEDPTVDMGDDFTVYLCGEREVCIDAIITDDNIETIYVNFGSYDSQTGQVCFIPDTTGSYIIVLTAIDACDVSADDTVVVTVIGGEAPYVDLGEDFSVALCEPSEICVDVETIEIFKSLSTNLGQYDEYTGRVCFLPDTSGVYTLIVEVTDSCDLVGADTVNITVELNSPPVVSGMTDSALYLCYPQEICLTVNVFDPDDDIDSIRVNRGNYENGQVCFVPYDSGHYEIIVTAVDSCGNVGADTALVIIETDQGVSIECPNDTTIFTCQLVDTFCLPISGIPENAEVEVWGINTWYDAQTQTICFWSECSNINHITVHVTTPCNTYSCEFTVTVECNSDPLVILPPDTTIPLCETADICLPVGISDVDNNLADIIVEGGFYDPTAGQVCFTADTAGTYVIRVTAVDSCGATDWDEIAIEVMLNSAPYISYELIDSIFSQCAPEEICIPVDIGDVDGNLDTVTISFGYYNAQTGEVCFTPDSTGRYCIQITAVDLCGLSTVAEICVTVETGNFVWIDCPLDPIDISLCNPGEVCWPLEITGDSFQVLTSDGSTWQDDTLCFFADTSGLYNIEVIAVAECNSDTCYVYFDVLVSEGVSITCPADTTVALCEPDTLCLTYAISFNVDTVTVTPPAFLSGLQVCVPLLDSGDHVIMMTAEGQCGTDTCNFTVTAQFNRPPVVDAGDDTTFTLCDLSEICVPFTASDPDTNIVGITSSLGVVDGNQVCFTPEDFETYEIIITVVDECGATAVDTVTVTVNLGGTVTIFCPEGIHYDTTCGPDTICVLVPITPSSAVVTVLPDGYYDSNTGYVCVGIDESGTYDITVIAEAFCGNDTCEFTLEVAVAEPPVITCPEVVDTTLCLVAPVTLCYPVAVTGSVSQISVNPIGSYSNGQVCLPVDTVGSYQIEIAAEGPCGVDTCYTTIQVEEDQAPQLFLPDYQTFELCLDDVDSICIIDTIYATDVESPVLLTMTCGVGIFSPITDSSGVVCFLPDSFGVYEFCFEAFDGCNTTVGSFFVEIRERDDCDVCLRLSIDGGECTPVGVVKEVDLHIESKTPIGGFDLLLNYDPSALSFESARIDGTDIEGWEYFTWHLFVDNPELVRLIGIADMNNGAQHPPDSTLTPNGLFIVMQIQVANDQNLGGYFLPINFVWFDCGDNAFSDPTGNDLYVDLRIFSPETLLIWDELDDVTYPELDRPYGLGAPDYCVEGSGDGKPAPIRCIEFINGGICVIHPDSFDKRGDINLNNISNEIADAVLFSNYFIYGLSVFKINVAGQIAASDVNADGMTLTVGDLVYMIRIIIGDADPLPKVSPYAEELIISTNYDADAISIATEAVNTIGAALFVYDISGDLVLDEPQLAPDAEGMDLMWAVENGELRLLVYDIGTNMIPTGVNDLVGIPCRGDGQLNLIRADVADYQGRPYKVAGKESGLPTGFALNQNYPNPFNPTTTISFRLPQSTEWRLEIFNITGSLVREYQGSNETGAVTVQWDGRSTDGLSVASGVYLYRLEAANFSDSKKMILLK